MIKRLFNSTSLKLNIVSNFFGNAGVAILGMLFLPFYLRYVGSEGYGLIGIFGSLQTILTLLDAGLGYTLNKELAALSVHKNKRQEMNNLLRTFEILYWILATIVFIVAMCLSPFIATHWIKPGFLSHSDIVNSFYLLSISMFFQFPSGLYTGGMLGIQRHFSLNFIKFFFALLKGVGSIFVLIYIDSTVIAFFTWNLLIAIINAVTIRWALWHYMPASPNKPLFDTVQLKAKWKFAAGISGIGVTAVLLTQLDKIILSKILSLKEFGYYCIATTLGLVIYQLIMPLSQSYFPKFSELIAKGDISILKKTYHQGSQLLSIIVLPVAFMLCFFSKEIISIWLKDKVIVDNIWLVVSIYSIGTAFNGLVNMPFMLSLSYEKPKIFFYANLFLSLLMIPMVFVGAIYFGTVGAASGWTILNIIYIIIMPYIIHRQMLQGELKKWYWQDIIRPLLGALPIVLLARWFFSSQNLTMSGFNSTLFLILIGLISLIAATITAWPKKLLTDIYSKYFGVRSKRIDSPLNRKL